MATLNGATTNGVNGHTVNGATSIKKGTETEIPVTKIFAEFVASASPNMLTPKIRTKLKEVIVDFIGVTAGAAKDSESTESIVKAIVALGGANGSSTVLATGKKFTPQHAALLNATFGHSFDWDDTYAEGTLHAGVTVIAAALAQAELSEVPADVFLTSILVGYEVTSRLGRANGFDAYDRGFHNTSTCGIFGAVATLSVLKHLPANTIEMAFGLAGSKAAGSMQYLENGSWNKRLHPGFAAHDAFMVVALAEAGVIGATKSIEGRYGFLHAYSPKQNKDLELLTQGLGSEWEFPKTALKPYPACRMTHGYIEMAGIMGREKREVEVSHVTLVLSPSNYNVVGQPAPNKIHPENAIDGQFSAYFQAAYALLHGSASGWTIYSNLDDAQTHALSDRISVVTDSSYRRFECGIKVEWADGTVKEERMPEPLGEVSHPFTRDKVDEKFFSLATGVYGEKRAVEIRDMVDDMEKHSVAELLGLLQ